MAVNEKRRRAQGVWAELFGGETEVVNESPTQAAPNVVVSGGTVFIGSGHVQNIVYDRAPTVHNGFLDACHKRRLLELRDQIVGVSRAVDGQQITPAAVLRRLEQHMDVRSYAEIPYERFAQAETYLVNWRARLEGMPGAMRSPGWRERKVRAINALCDEMRAGSWRRSYIRRRWGKASMADLSNEEVGQLHKAVVNRIRQEV